jgi:cytochrome bd-type quinol oxidase subunit 2
MKQEKSKKKTVQAESKATFDQQDFAFDKLNYKWLLIALGFLVVGFILMIGGNSDDPNVFNYGMFNFQRLTLSPILLIIGYILGIYAIMKKPKGTK